MKITIREEEGLSEMEITIKCGQINKDVEKLISLLRVLDLKLTGTKGEQTYILDASDVLYIDTADKKVFFYTKEEIFETSLKLYELEDRLRVQDFMRANKSCIINFNHIKVLKADIDGKLLVTMSNGEKIKISRQYASDFKRKLTGAG